MCEQVLIVGKQACQQIDSVLRSKSAELDVWKAVYFNVTFKVDEAASVKPWDIRPISDRFICYKDFCRTMEEFIDGKVGEYVEMIRKRGVISLSPQIINKYYAVAILGQMVDTNIFLTGLCSEIGPDADKLELILRTGSIYDTVEEFKRMCESTNMCYR